MADVRPTTQEEPSDEPRRDEAPDSKAIAPHESAEEVQEELEDDDRFQATDN